VLAGPPFFFCLFDCHSFLVPVVGVIRLLTRRANKHELNWTELLASYHYHNHHQNILHFFCFLFFCVAWDKKVKCILVQAPGLCTGRTVHRGSRCIALLFLDHGTRGAWGLTFTPRPLFTSGERPGTHCTGGWVGPKAGLDRCGKSCRPSTVT